MSKLTFYKLDSASDYKRYSIDFNGFQTGWELVREGSSSCKIVDSVSGIYPGSVRLSRIRSINDAKKTLRQACTGVGFDFSKTSIDKDLTVHFSA